MDTALTPGPSLPPGLWTRPLITTESRAVYDLMALDQLDVLGRVEIEEADIVSDWQRPSFDVTTSTVGVFDDEQLVGYAEIGSGDRGDAAVAPTHRGRGIGTWLAHWMQQRARATGRTIIGMPVVEQSPGDRLLAALGYHVRWTSWVLRIPEGATIPERALPPGYVAREATPADYAAIHTVVEDAFLEWSQRERESFADFEAAVLRRPGFEPWHARVINAPDGTIVATAILSVFEPEDGPRELYVNRLATRADQRNQGLAQALLVDCFAAGRAHGAPTGGLSTDSRTGALELYQKVGMEVTDVWVHRARHL